jgi:hypothetical protein
VPEPSVQRLSDEEIFVQLAEDLRDRRASHVARNAESVELLQRAQPSVPLHERFRSGAGHGGTAVIQCAFLSQTGDGGINLASLEVTAHESRAHLRFRQLTPRKPS